MIKRFLRIVGALCLVVVIHTPCFVSAQTYRKPVPILPITFDPRNFVDSYSGLVISQIYDKLFVHDELMRLRKNLVSDYSSDESGQVWVLHLRKDVTFHDGKEFTVDDVAFTLKQLMQGSAIRYHQLFIIKGAKDYHEGRAADVAGIEILGPYTMRISLEKPFPPFLSVLASSNTEVLPKDFGGRSEAEFFKKPLGTGPFKFGKYARENYVHLVRNPNYFKKGTYLQDIYYIKAKREQAIKGFNDGSYQDLEWFYPKANELKRSYRTVISPAAKTTLVVFNLRRSPLNDVHVRRAIAMALDKQKIVKMCIPQAQAAKGYIPPGVLGYYPEMTDLPFDLAKARIEIKKARVDRASLSRPLKLLKPDNHPCQESFKQHVEKNLKKIGLNVEVVYVPMSEIIFAINDKEYDTVSFNESAGFPEAVFMLNPFHSAHVDNFTGTTDLQLDKMIDAIFQAQDRYKRIDLYRRIQERLVEQAYLISLYYNSYSGVYQDYIRGINFTPLMTYLSQMNTVRYEKQKGE